MLTMIHGNPARLVNGTFVVDRKFHDGMQRYLHNLDLPLLTVHPRLPEGQDHTVMDRVEIPERELGYSVLTVAVDRSNRPVREERPALEQAVRDSKLVYGMGFGIHAAAARHNIPMVCALECNLKTTMVVASAGVDGAVRRTWRRARACRYYLTEQIPTMRYAVMLHCNGYPMFEEAAWFNRRRLLYLDSRMRREMVIGEDELERRLVDRQKRRPRLLFSGRFEPIKGAFDAVLVARECHRMGMEFEMQLYGKGSQREAMEGAIKEHGLTGTTVIHDPLPFPELVKAARGFDLFICCHVQDDPSCTYLESLGCGLPIAGYGNAMWRSMCADSKAGVVTSLGSPRILAEAVRALIADPGTLNAMSRRARQFALEHSFELEFARRTDSLRSLYREQR